MTTRSILRAIACAATALACLSAQAQDIRIGANFPLSGPQGSYGDVFMTGSNLAVDHINADKMLPGKLSIVYEDSQGTPQRGVIGMNKLVNVDKVPYVLSSFTGVLKATAPIAARSKTPILNGSGVAPELAEQGPFFWNVLPLISFDVKAMLPYLIKERKAKRFVLIYVDETVGQAVLKEMESTLPAAGGELVAALSIPASLQQFSGIAAKVREARPDAIYIASWGAQQVQIVKQLRDNGVTQQLASFSTFVLPELEALPESKGALYTTQHVNWDSPDPVTRRFVESFRAKYPGKQPTIYAANFYNSVRLFALLSVELQKKGKPITGENLLAQRLETKAFDMVGGRIVFQDNGTVAAPMQVNEYDGKSTRVIAVLPVQ
ncbi:ABC transporter substrate-binding protein [Xylophilus sp. GOD-11R]|uniref:ABC transporter substrate-binding protein n=1 Tax=Xylophilus sp. GOD-11R TaxID=3089814 RepID=UPI00298BFA18|nr:ABC transporter substrate-binding protein [Xylophilus sp. GOD-11R]WPB55451.1 ABC transporter substrate-binding protein [Xylophilus sp. GOD-11R]